MRKVQNVVAALRVVVTPEFVRDGMNIDQMGDQALSYLKKIFPKSPADYPNRGREPLVEGWMKFNHPAKGFSRNPGFTIRRKNSDLRDHEIIAALDQGSRAYSRIIPPGTRTSFLKTTFDPFHSNQPIGQPVFLTGTGLLFHYRQRQGLYFMDRTYQFVLSMMSVARKRYKEIAKRRIVNSAR